MIFLSFRGIDNGFIFGRPAQIVKDEKFKKNRVKQSLAIGYHMMFELYTALKHLITENSKAYPLLGLYLTQQLTCLKALFIVLEKQLKFIKP